MADDHNTPNFITVNVVLNCLFWAYAGVVPDNREQYLDWSRLCGVNVETALSNLPLHLPASDDVIVALSLGVISSNQHCAFLELTVSLDLLCDRAIKTLSSLDSDIKSIRALPNPGLPPE